MFKGKEKAIAAGIISAANIAALYIVTGTFDEAEVTALLFAVLTVFGVYETTNRTKPQNPIN